jgi:glycosyltransferase involved in cell wall biosynthesis
MISILINNYNNGPWIQAAVDSALNQTRAADEVIVYDDGSTDDSLATLRSYGNRIQLIEGIHNHDLPGCQNQAIAVHRAFLASTGNHLYILDGDDCYLPQHIETYEKAWDLNPAAVMFHGSMMMVDETGKHLTSLFRQDRHRTNYRRDIYQNHEVDYFYPTSSLAFRRELLERELPIDYASGALGYIDALLSFAAVFSGAIGSVTEDTALYRRRDKSLSASNGYRDQSQIEKTRFRIAGFNAIATSKGHPPIRLWLNFRYIQQLARHLTPRWVSQPFVDWKLKRYRKMQNRPPKPPR